MLRRLWGRVHLDRAGLRVWVDGSRYQVSRSGDEYVCRDLPAERLSSLRVEDIPEGLVFKAVAPLNMGAAVYVRRGWVNVEFYVARSTWSYAVGVDELEVMLTNTLSGLGYDVKSYRGHGRVEAAISCTGRLETYIEGLLRGLEGFGTWVLGLDASREQEANKIFARMSKIDGRCLAAGGGVLGIARILVASLTREDIAYLLLETDNINTHIKSLVFRKMGLNERDVCLRLGVLGLYKRGEEGLEPSWPYPAINILVKNLYSSWGGGAAVSRYLNAYYLMAYIHRNLYPLVVRGSRYGRDVRWRYGLKRFLEERLYPGLTFIDVAVTASLCLGIQSPLYRLKESFNTLKNLGVLSENLKPKPYAIQITRLVKG